MKRAAWVGILVFTLIGLMPVWADVPLVDDVDASDGEEYDYFGASVSVSRDVCVIGADGDDDRGTDAGAAYIFWFEDPNWVEEAKLTASDGQEYDYFGWSVSVSGEVCVVGARGDDDNGLASGSSYVFRMTKRLDSELPAFAGTSLHLRKSRQVRTGMIRGIHLYQYIVKSVSLS